MKMPKKEVAVHCADLAFNIKVYANKIPGQMPGLLARSGPIACR